MQLGFFSSTGEQKLKELIDSTGDPPIKHWNVDDIIDIVTVKNLCACQDPITTAFKVRIRTWQHQSTVLITQLFLKIYLCYATKVLNTLLTCVHLQTLELQAYFQLLWHLPLRNPRNSWPPSSSSSSFRSETRSGTAVLACAEKNVADEY